MKTVLFLLATLPLFAEVWPSTIKKDLAYRAESEDAYQNERCKLDLYLPEGMKDFPILVWFHGGGMTGGSKDNKQVAAIGESLAKEGIAVVIPNYRLHPKAKFPTYIEDAAAAVAWAFTSLEQTQGREKIFVGGHSAGGTLTLLLGMDPRYLAAHNLTRNQLAGLIPVSAQTMTHYTIREERFGTNDPFTITADDASPVRYCSQKGIPPMLILWADNDAPARAEENAYLAAVLKGAKNTTVQTAVITNRNHSSIAHRMSDINDPGAREVIKFIRLNTEKPN